MVSPGTELIRRMATGDRDALAPFYDLYAPLAFGLLRRMLRDVDEAAEVLQEVFWELWRAAGQGGAGGGGGAGDRTRARGVCEEWAAGHVLGALGGEEASRFAAHLAGGCAACERAVIDYQEALARAAAAVREAPPARVRHALFQRAGEQPARRSRLALGLAWAASVVLAAGIGAWASPGHGPARSAARLAQLARE